MAELLGKGREYPSGLAWFDAAGIGYYPVNADPYDQAYFDKYCAYGISEMGQNLNAARVDLVGKYYKDSLLCDVGIGSGSFIQARWDAKRKLTLGYDVNPLGVAWLKDRGLFIDPYLCKLPAISLWDVLEHIAEPWPLIANCRQWLFTALPIFKDREHAERSKHFRRDEHYWYFTAGGLIFLMSKLGFDLVAQSDIETRLGREDIGSFAFRRKDA
jgi:hypothetical protein